MPKLAFRVSAIVPGKEPDSRCVSFQVRYLPPPGTEPVPAKTGSLTIELPSAVADTMETWDEFVLKLAPSRTEIEIGVVV
jgi:hypothetical protein